MRQSRTFVQRLWTVWVVGMRKQRVAGMGKESVARPGKHIRTCMP
mgnify:CR=1 FL=1